MLFKLMTYSKYSNKQKTMTKGRNKINKMKVREKVSSTHYYLNR